MNLGVIESWAGKNRLCLDDPGFSTRSGTLIDQWGCNYGFNQRWAAVLTGFEADGDAMYQIRNDYSGLCLDASGYGTAPGTLVQQWSCHNPPTPNQEWVFSEATFDGTPTITNEGTGGIHSDPILTLDIVGRSTKYGAHIQLWDFHNTANQLWVCEFGCPGLT